MDAAKLDEQERAILAFMRRHFQQNKVPLRMLDVVPIEDTGKIIEG